MPNPAQQAAEGRHSSIVHLARYFEYAHLPEPLRSVSAMHADMAAYAIEQLPDTLELAAGLRKLLEAKDCLVRCALDLEPEDAPHPRPALEHELPDTAARRPTD